MQTIHKKIEIWNADETQIIGFCNDIIESFDILKSKNNCIIIFIGIDANVKKNFENDYLFILKTKYLKEEIRLPFYVNGILSHNTNSTTCYIKIPDYYLNGLLTLTRDIKKLTEGMERPWCSIFKNNIFLYLRSCFHTSSLQSLKDNKNLIEIDQKYIFDKYSLFSKFGYAFFGKFGYMGSDYDGLWDCLIDIPENTIIKMDLIKIEKKIKRNDWDIFNKICIDMEKRLGLIIQN